MFDGAGASFWGASNVACTRNGSLITTTSDTNFNMSLGSDSAFYGSRATLLKRAAAPPAGGADFFQQLRPQHPVQTPVARACALQAGYAAGPKGQQFAARIVGQQQCCKPSHERQMPHQTGILVALRKCLRKCLYIVIRGEAGCGLRRIWLRKQGCQRQRRLLGAQLAAVQQVLNAHPGRRQECRYRSDVAAALFTQWARRIDSLVQGIAVLDQ
jgi:hypothetical protein